MTMSQANYKFIGKNAERWDAVAKVTGRAEYTADFYVKNALHAKICRATIAHGMVKKLDISEAEKVSGVVKIVTPDDVSQHKFPTAGHPYSLDPSKGDIFDKYILTRHVRMYGDEIAAVIAETEFAAEIAVSKIKVEYDEYPFYLTPEEALAESAVRIAEEGNLLADTTAEIGDVERGFAESKYIIEDELKTQTVQHCTMETQTAYAYQDSDGRWVCVSSTQIPHICRRILGHAFGMNWSKFRVIKPFIGGGFGNKQDVCIEPLTVALSMAVSGRPVRLALTREEGIGYTRARHAISYKMKMGLTADGKINALKVHALSNGGAYAAHGHSITVKGAGILATLYSIPNLEYRGQTAYTNITVAGAMRGYGTPQVIFAIESLVDNACREFGFDLVDFRSKNFFKEGHEHPFAKLKLKTFKLEECMRLGIERFDYYKKKEAAKKHNASGGVTRRGVGFAAFSYATGVHPYLLEIAGCRLTLNQDGTVKMMVGASEIGQGSDTVLAQIAAEVLGIDLEHIYADANTDTDYAPFDPASYASRQTYVGGMAVKLAAEELRAKIIKAAETFHGAGEYELVDGYIINDATGEKIETLAELVLKSYYDIPKGGCLTAEVSYNMQENAYPCGITFAEVEVDSKTGEVRVVSMLNVHDSGVIINPLLAEGQVEGGMGMGVPYCLAEEMLYDQKTGKPLNNNLLDYKMPTMMDLPDFDCAFVEPHDPTSAFGNKGLGEPPACSPAGAIRNAVVDAVDVYYNDIPLTPQRVLEGLAKKGGGAGV